MSNCSTSRTWKSFLNSMSHNQLRKVINELVTIIDSTRPTSTEACCEYIMLLHGIALPMPEMDDVNDRV